MKGCVENIPCLEYDSEEEEFTIHFDDVEDVYYAYMRSPLVNTFIKYEILVRRKLVYERDYSNVSRYEVYGFIYDEQGESYEVTLEWIQEARDWINNEF
jgi:Mg2+ and Co2+ transporter CorA